MENARQFCCDKGHLLVNGARLDVPEVEIHILGHNDDSCFVPEQKIVIRGAGSLVEIKKAINYALCIEESVPDVVTNKVPDAFEKTTDNLGRPPRDWLEG